jgi:hypothetical protein
MRTVNKPVDSTIHLIFALINSTQTQAQCYTNLGPVWEYDFNKCDFKNCVFKNCVFEIVTF